MAGNRLSGRRKAMPTIAQQSMVDEFHALQTNADMLDFDAQLFLLEAAETLIEHGYARFSYNALPLLMLLADSGPSDRGELRSRAYIAQQACKGY